MRAYTIKVVIDEGRMRVQDLLRSLADTINEHEKAGIDIETRIVTETDSTIIIHEAAGDNSKPGPIGGTIAMRGQPVEDKMFERATRDMWQDAETKASGSSMLDEQSYAAKLRASQAGLPENVSRAAQGDGHVLNTQTGETVGDIRAQIAKALNMDVSKIIAINTDTLDKETLHRLGNGQ